MRQLSAILELEGHYRGKDAARYDHAIQELQRSIVGSTPVVYVQHDFREQPTTVPDFGHDYRCRCDEPLPHGVKRYFSLSLFVEGEPFDTVMGDYEIANGRLIITGIVSPLYDPESEERLHLPQLRTTGKRKLRETRVDGTPIFA